MLYAVAMKKNETIELLFESQDEIEVAFDTSAIWWKKDMSQISVIRRGTEYKNLKWNELTLQEQEIMERF